MSQDTPSNRHAPTLDSPDIDGRIARLAATATDAERFLWAVVGVTVVLDVALTAYGLDLGLVEEIRSRRRSSSGTASSSRLVD
ncbi:hypothetical protein ACFQJD_08265 [Haloplanus sp. GCM10025708]|uniref:hypothetical protein n=1 Tax=Haloplanus sp. GCM10025708 TaxID=3252679 RepID=UPI003617AD25